VVPVEEVAKTRVSVDDDESDDAEKAIPKATISHFAVVLTRGQH
jgi:hypothetical protein